jgi:hypothetical protein
MSTADLRKESRVRSRGQVHLWIDDREYIAAIIHDVSVSGLCVETDTAATPGVCVRIEGTGFTGAAIVRYCGASGPAFRLGLELLPEPAA